MSRCYLCRLVQTRYIRYAHTHTHHSHTHKHTHTHTRADVTCVVSYRPGTFGMLSSSRRAFARYTEVRGGKNVSTHDKLSPALITPLEGEMVKTGPVCVCVCVRREWYHYQLHVILHNTSPHRTTPHRTTPLDIHYTAYHRLNTTPLKHNAYTTPPHVHCTNTKHTLHHYTYTTSLGIHRTNTTHTLHHYTYTTPRTIVHGHPFMLFLAATRVGCLRMRC
jgi:hypothetical protein